MTTAIGVVMTEHIVAGRMENHRLVGELVRYPGDTDEVDALTVLPGGELVEILANQVTEACRQWREAGRGHWGRGSRGGSPWSGGGSPNLTQIKGMRMADELARVFWAARHQSARCTSPTMRTRSPRESPPNTASWTS